LANTGSAAATRASFIRSKPVNDMYTSPRTSISGGWPAPRSRSGTSRTVRRLGVTSSPTAPLPRVAPTASTPSR
jgi:hypothetical protein